MPYSEVGSILAVDVGSCWTKAALFEVVDGQHRFVASGEALTSLSWPLQDVSIGVREAVARIERICGRVLVGKNGPIVPEGVNGTGVDFFTTTTTAGENLRLFAVTAPQSTFALQQFKAVAAVHGIATEDISIDELGQTAEARRSTIARRLRATRPHAIFLIGQANTDQPLSQQEVNSLAPLGDDLAAALQECGLDEIPVRFVGGPEAIDNFMRGISANLDYRRLATPDGANEGQAGFEQEFQALWQQNVAEQVPGLASILSWQDIPPQHSSLAFGNSIRFLAKYFQAHVVGLDIGASHVNILNVGPNKAQVTMNTTLGIGRNALNLLSNNSSTNLSSASRWLPFDMRPDEIYTAILNKWARPWTAPETQPEAFLERAVGIESAHRARAQAEEQPSAPQEADALMLQYRQRPGLVIGAGSLITNQKSPGRKALTIVDALEPAGVFEIAVDRYAAMALLGAVARQWPQAAAEALLGDCLDYLGVCIASVGRPHNGAKVATLELKQGNVVEKIEVEAGELRLVSLDGDPSLQDVELAIKPQGGIDFGWGKGKAGKVKFRPTGLGLIIDTRGRPIELAADLSGKDQVRRWIETMDRPAQVRETSGQLSYSVREEAR